MKANWRTILTYLLLILIGVALIAPLFSTETKVKELPFSSFLDQIEQNKIKEVTIAGDMISGVLADKTKFHTRAMNYPNLVPQLRDKGITIRVESPVQSNWAWDLFIQLLAPVAFFALFWWLMMRQAQGMSNQAMSFGRANVKPQTGKITITFANVAGVDEAKEELKEIVEFLKTPAKFQALGAKIPKGLLLMGAPGTGKTLLARAIAGEAGVPFFSISGSDFVEMFVGVGASRVRSVFDQAKKQTPSIIFMDEIDAVGRHRGAGFGGGHDEREQTLNQLLVEMDGFSGNEGIIVIAATNRADILDKALLRPGRFDRQVQVGLPDIKGREQILNVHADKVPLADDVNIKDLARGTPGFSGAELANLINEGALFAARNNQRVVTMNNLDKARDKMLMGAEKRTMIMSKEDLLLTAYHEAGHVIVGRIVPEHDPVYKVSIMPRGGALGITMFLPERDQYSVSKDKLEGQISGLFGGRVAEALIYGKNKVTTGASNDIQRATQLARNMVTKWGLSDRLGPMDYGDNESGYMGLQSRPMSEHMAQIIDEEIRQVVDSNYLRAETILKEHIDILHNMAHALLDWETLDKYQIDELMQGRMIAPPEPEIEQSSSGEDEHRLSDGEVGHENPGKGLLVLS